MPETDTPDLPDVVDDVVQENDDDWVTDYFGGEDGALNYAVGQVLERVGGSAHPGRVHELLEERVDDVQLVYLMGDREDWGRARAIAGPFVRPGDFAAFEEAYVEANQTDVFAEIWVATRQAPPRVLETGTGGETDE